MSATSAATLNRRAALASVAVAALLVALKAWAAWQTGSVAMLGSLADTGLDLAASVITLLAIRWAAQPADAEHRFGHGKAEALAALFQVSLISVAAVLIILQAIARIGNAARTSAPEAGIAVSAVAMAATLALLWYQHRVIARTGSVAIAADHAHYQSDMLLNIAVVAALLLDAALGITGADALFGVGIGLWLGYGAWRAANEAVGQLMDREWPLERREEFLKVAAGHPELRGIHDMRTRTSGARDFVQFHMWVDPALTVAQAHRVMDEVEAKLTAAFPDVEILIHPDPAGHIDRDIPMADVDAATLVASEKAAS